MHWQSPQSPREKKARMCKSKFKIIMIVFFEIQGVFYIDWVREGQTVNQVYYKNVLTTLRVSVRRRRPDMWKNASWILHHDNAPAHNALSVKMYLAKKHSRDGTSTVLSGHSTVRIFSSSRKSSLRSKEPGLCPWMQWKQNRRNSWTA